jgi:ABC-type antimicrobial peptide transport system permease subunit
MKNPKFKLLIIHILKGINSHRKRTFLTLLGILLSVISYFVGTILVNAVYGLQTDTYSNFNPHSAYLTEQITVAKLGELKVKYRNSKIQSFVYLPAKAISYANVAGEHDELVPYYSNFFVQFIGVEKEFASYSIPSVATGNCIEQPSLLLGRNFSEEDFIFQRKVVVLHYTYAKEIFGDVNPLGQDFLVEGMGQYKVIGLLTDTADVRRDVKRANRRALDSLSQNNNTTLPIYIPNTSIGSYTNITRTIFTFGEVDMKSVYKVLNADLFNNRGGNLFTLDRILDDLQEEIENVNRTILGLMMIMLLISGISLSTILSFSFKERIAEIGLKKALGAKDEDILNQFFLESFINGVIGGVVGLLAGVVIVLIVGPIFLELTYKGVLRAITFEQILVPMLLSILISILFSLIPSVFAVKKNIVEALRGE